MTKRQTLKLLSHIQHKKLKRSEIRKFCTGKTDFDCDREINALCTEKMIGMASEPKFEKGIFKSDPSDLFEIDDAGKDRLAEIRKDYICTYLPITISILALAVSIVGLMR